MKLIEESTLGLARRPSRTAFDPRFICRRRIRTSTTRSTSRLQLLLAVAPYISRQRGGCGTEVVRSLESYEIGPRIRSIQGQDGVPDMPHKAENIQYAEIGSVGEGNVR